MDGNQGNLLKKSTLAQEFCVEGTSSRVCDEYVMTQNSIDFSS